MTSVANGIRSYDKAVTSDRDGHFIGPALEQKFVDRPAGAPALVADDLAGGGRVEHELADLVPRDTDVGELVRVVHDVLEPGLRVTALQEDNLPVAVLTDQDHLVRVMFDSVGGQLRQQFLAGRTGRLADGVLAALATESTEDALDLLDQFGDLAGHATEAGEAAH